MASCAPPEHIAYHSTAEIPYETEDTQTQMRLVGEPSDGPGTRRVAVLIGTDDGQISYGLLAPMSSNASEYILSEVELERSVPLRKKKVQALLNGLDETLGEWGQGGSDEGTFYEFLHAPQQELRWGSDDVVVWDPSVRFTASHTGTGSTARLALGASSSLSSSVKYEDREAVLDLRDLLRKAKRRLQRRE